MRRHKWIFAAVIICISSQIVCGQSFEMMHDGIVRTYVVYEPNNLDPNSGGYPLLIGLHGTSADGATMIAVTDLVKKANREKFIVACPDGLNYGIYTYFNAGDGYEELTNGTDDLGFISALIDTMIANYNVDPTRVYATGFSNGSMMAYRLAAEISHQIAAIGAVSGPMLLESCNPEYPVPIIHIHGLSDTSVPYEGVVRLDLTFPPVDSSLAIWREINGCSSIPDTILNENGIVGKKWASVDGKGDIILYTIEGWGHKWPKIGQAGIDATDLIWDFLKSHQRGSVTDSNDWFVFCFEADEEIISTPAIDHEGTIYFGTQNATLYAVDCNGNLKWNWRYETEGCPPQSFEASPVIGEDGTIYVADDVAIPNYLFAISPEGEKKWEYVTGVVRGSMDASPVLLSDGTIFAGAHGSSGRGGLVGELVAITPDGTVLDGFPLQTGAIYTSPVAVEDVVIVGETRFAFDKVFAVNKNADILWETELYDSNGIHVESTLSSLAVDRDNNILVAQNIYDWTTRISSSQIIQLSLLNGEILFKMPIQTQSSLAGELPIQMPMHGLADVAGSPIIDVIGQETSVIVATRNAHLISVNPYTDGEKLNYDLALGENSKAVGSPVIGDNGKLYHAVNSVGDANQIDVFEINPDGTINESFKVTITNDHVSSSLTMGNNGVLYFGTKEGKLYAVQTDANGLSRDAPWPTFRHDIRNTGNSSTTRDSTSF